jgi:hypothetical protein
MAIIVRLEVSKETSLSVRQLTFTKFSFLFQSTGKDITFGN